MYRLNVREKSINLCPHVLPWYIHLVVVSCHG
jgi:hypothetical protein